MDLKCIKCNYPLKFTAHEITAGRWICRNCKAMYSIQCEAPCELIQEPDSSKSRNNSVLQDWVSTIPLMQQSVLLSAIRGPDGLPDDHIVKKLLKWYRRCILLDAFSGEVLSNPRRESKSNFTGGSLPEPNSELYAGPWENDMDIIVSDYLKTLDGVPRHFHLHFIHAIEILGYKHPDKKIREWWYTVYAKMVKEMHLNPETMAQMDERLGDDPKGWRQASI